MNEQQEFQPYIPASQVRPELTVTSVITGIVLAVVFGAANAYLGLRVGMTVSASIPAAVLAMGILRVALRRNSVLESNVVQTIGSAGESVAAGAIFTLPALFLWAAEGRMAPPKLTEIALIALLGGLLGVFFMVPLRNALIVREHGVLPYPEGTACAQVLLAGEKGGAGASTVFAGMGFAAAVKLVLDGLRLVPGQISLRFRGYAGEIGTQIYPAVLSVGYICGPKIASYMFTGGLVSWMVLIPAIVLFGAQRLLYPGTVPIGELFAQGGAEAVWRTYVRYIGAGALACGGILSLAKALPLILRTFRDAIRSLGKGGGETTLRTQRDIPLPLVLGAVAVLTVLVWLVPAIPVTLPGAIMVVVFGFFFATVSSRMVGLVGSSNNPVSGMAIATLLMATLLLKLGGSSGMAGMHSAIAIGSIICIVAAISGDTSQDLKTGFLLGATPKKQQIGEVLGVTASALAIGGTLYLLHAAWGFGSEELGAPQATLMKLIVEGVMENSLSWPLVFLGVFLALGVEILGVPVLPFAIGLYLPVQLNACVMIGGLVRLLVEKKAARREKGEAAVNRGLLFCSGMIAGEGLVGILLALLAVIGLSGIMDLSGWLPAPVKTAGSIALLALVALVLLRVSLRQREENP